MKRLSIQEKKQQNPYKVRGLANSTKDVDMNKRTVTGMFNSFFWIDSNLDMLIPGCCKRSISQRGPGTSAGNKIKHLKDHSWEKVIARVDVIEERAVSFNGNTLQGVYHESYYPDTPESNDMLLKIQEKLYDARSIGFQYMDLAIAEKGGNDEENDLWERFYPMALNPEKAEENGFFFVVREIALFEGSDVAFGANELTPMLGVKSGDGVSIFDQLQEKLDIIDSLETKGKLSDEGFYRLSMEKKQLRQLLTIAQKSGSSVKDTLIQERENRILEKEQNKPQENDFLREFYLKQLHV